MTYAVRLGRYIGNDTAILQKMRDTIYAENKLGAVPV